MADETTSEALAAAFLALWQRNLACWAADPLADARAAGDPAVAPDGARGRDGDAPAPAPPPSSGSPDNGTA